MSANASDERRQHERIRIDLLVRFRFGSLASFIAEHAVNLSPGGMFIRTQEPPEVGTRVFLQFSLEDGSQLIDGVATVVRQAPAGSGGAAGFGVQFEKLDGRSRALLEGICARKEAESRSGG